MNIFSLEQWERDSQYVNELRQRVAELEAEVIRLREALHYSLGAWHYDGISDEHGSIFKEASDRCDTPFTPTALNELVEKVERRTIERCVNSCKSESERWNIRLATANRDASELVLRGYSAREDSAYDCSMAIRALPVGQIKLEELL